MTTIFKEDIYSAKQGENAIGKIDTLQNFCPCCQIAQTYVQGKKKLKKKFQESYVKIVYDCIVNNNLKIFTKKQLMTEMNIVNVSNGVLQDHALSILIMLGYIRRENQVYVDEDGNEKERSIYIKNNEIKPPECYDYQSDKHISFDWFGSGIRKRFYKRGENENHS